MGILARNIPVMKGKDFWVCILEFIIESIRIILKEGEMNKGKLVIYKDKRGETKLDVRLRDETVWLSQKQMSTLFNKDVRTINEHIQNIYSDKELNRELTIRNFRIVQLEGRKQVIRKIDHYNLDVIISVGYRVKSLRGTQFRIWANGVLKNYLLQGYAVNEKRLLESQNKLKELQETITFIKNSTDNPDLLGQEKELLSVINAYSSSLDLLEKYDEGKLRLIGRGTPKFILKYQDASDVILTLKEEVIKRRGAGIVFGNEIDNKFNAIVGSIYQTFDSKDLYPTIEEKAANLLYLTIKDHAFSDGNKRIASILFVYFLNKNNYLYKNSGERKVNDNTLVALAILIATSLPSDKDVLIRLLVNILKN